MVECFDGEPEMQWADRGDLDAVIKNGDGDGADTGGVVAVGDGVRERFTGRFGRDFWFVDSPGRPCG